MPLMEVIVTDMGPTWIMPAVDHNINAPKTLCGLVHYRADLLLVRHITGDSHDLGAALRQVLLSARQF